MKKTKILAVLGILLAMGITACNGGGGNDNSQGEQPQSQEVSEHVHEFGEWVQTKAPTCTEKGTEERTCACGEKETRNVKANGHTYVEVAIADDTETDPAHKAKAPDCVNTGIKVEVCSVCGNRKESTIPANGHTFVEVSPENDTETDPAKKAKAPTCTETGIKVEVCSVCNYRQESTIRATGHTNVELAPADDTAPIEIPDGDTEAQHRAKAATCTEAGIKVEICSVCGARTESEIAALGHVYEQENGADKVDWTKRANCTEPGAGTKTCTRCGDVANVVEEPLDHLMKLVGGEVTPEPGKAAVRLYDCQREGCDQTYLGFKATEVSAASEPHLVTEMDGEDEGKRFWGRPIGNAVALDENGGADRNDHAPVFDKTETGDFFEYVFDLTAEQAAVLSTCLCYCDAKPAQYMNSNRLDFWAAGSGEEWTPGMYIDDDPAHIDEEGNGKQITDYRYILYVDDQVQEFDPSFKSPVPSGDPRGEYIMPFVFHLHAGTNKISLRMAGGYRSVFFNFIFRPFENTHNHTLGEWQSDANNHWKLCTGENCFGAEGTQFKKDAHSFGAKYDVVEATCEHAGSYKQKCSVCDYVKETKVAQLAHTFGDAGTKIGHATPYTCSVCNNTVYELAFGTDNNNENKAAGKFNSGNVTWNIAGLPAGTYAIQVNAGISSQNVNNVGFNDDTGGKGSDGDGTNGKARYQWRVDSGEYVSPTTGTAKYGEVGVAGSSSRYSWTSTVGQIVIGEGAAVFEMKYTGSGYSLNVSGVRLVKIA